MTLPQLIEAYYDTTELSEEEALESLNTLFKVSMPLDEKTFARQHITQKDAEAIALTNRGLISNYLKYHKSPIELITPTVAKHPNSLAQHLAVHEPIAATQLLDELLYWRKQGRI